MTPAQIIQDPNFLNKTDYEGKRTVLSTIDPRFKGMSQQDQNTVLDQLQPLPAGGFQGPGSIPPGTNNSNFGQASPQPSYPLSPITDILPTLGAGLGMVAGEGLLSVPAAGLGGAAGSEISSALKEKFPKLFGPGPDSPEYEATIQGLLQGVAPEAGGQILGALAKGGIPAAQAMAAALKAGSRDVAVGTAKIAGGAGVAGGAHALGLGPFGEYMLGKPLIVKGMKQVGKGVKNAIYEGKTLYSLLKDSGDIDFPNPSAQEQGAFLKPGEEGFQMKSPAPARQLTNQSQLDLRPNDVEISDEPFELSGGQFPTQTPTQPKLTVENPVDTSKVPVKPISYKDSQNPDVAKNLQVGTKRTMPDGSTQVLQSVPIHPRILADVKNGKTNITTWVPAAADK